MPTCGAAAWHPTLSFSERSRQGQGAHHEAASRGPCMASAEEAGLHPERRAHCDFTPMCYDLDDLL
eukprot:978108-Alexandrium_andersonii.AAC.1